VADLEVAVKFMSGMARRELIAVIGRLRRGEEVVVINPPPAFPRASRGHAEPDDAAAARAKLLREPVDIGDDADNGFDFAEIEILHIDDEQGGPPRIEAIEHRKLSALGEHPIDDILRKPVGRFHAPSLPFSLVSIYSHGAETGNDLISRCAGEADLHRR